MNCSKDLRLKIILFEPNQLICSFGQRTLAYFVRRSINFHLTSCFICSASVTLLMLIEPSVTLLMLNEQQIHFFGEIQTSQAGGQLYTYTSPYKVSYYSLLSGAFQTMANLTHLINVRWNTTAVTAGARLTPDLSSGEDLAASVHRAAGVQRRGPRPLFLRPPPSRTSIASRAF